MINKRIFFINFLRPVLYASFSPLHPYTPTQDTEIGLGALCYEPQDTRSFSYFRLLKQ